MPAAFPFGGGYNLAEEQASTFVVSLVVNHVVPKLTVSCDWPYSEGLPIGEKIGS